MAYSSLPLRTQPVLPLFPLKKTNPQQLISKHCSASEYAFFLWYGARAIAMTTAAIHVDELVPPPEQLLTILF